MKTRPTPALALAVLVALATTAPSLLALDNGLARTPPMGWNTYNCGVKPSEQNLRQIANALMASALRDAGYVYVNIDGGWWGDDSNKRVYLWPDDGEVNGVKHRAGDFHLDPKLFPHGIESLSKYLHERGLKLGFYSAPGISHGREVQHANLLAAWGVDFLKYDGYDVNQEKLSQYHAMRDALAKCGRAIVLSINTGWKARAPELANLWRTSRDIEPKWATILECFDTLDGKPGVAGPGGWNDIDMLEVGNMASEAEAEAHFSLWAIAAAPLIAGNDVRAMTLATKFILLNTEVIAVNQDAAGTPGTRVAKTRDVEVWSKPLHDGSRAVLVLNRSTNAPAEFNVTWAGLGLPAGEAQVRDLWAHRNLGGFKDGHTTKLPAPGAVMLKITSGKTPLPEPKPTWAPSPSPAQEFTPLDRTGWKASSSIRTDDENPARAIDANLATRWSSHVDQAADQWFQVDMSGLRTFDRVVLDDGQFGPQPKPYEVFASDRGYEVLVSDDGQTWRGPVADGPRGPRVTDLRFPTQTARFIRVRPTGNPERAHVSVWWGFDEFYVYDMASRGK